MLVAFLAATFVLPFFLQEYHQFYLKYPDISVIQMLTLLSLYKRAESKEVILFLFYLFNFFFLTLLVTNLFVFVIVL